MIRIKIPADHFSKRLKSAKKLKNWIDSQWELCEKGQKDCDIVYQITKENIDNFLSKNLSMNSFTKIFDEETNRKEDEVYDVTKVVMSKKDEDKFFDYDFELLKIFKGNFYKDLKIRKDISMYYLMNGFKVRDIESGYIFLEDNVLRKREED